MKQKTLGDAAEKWVADLLKKADLQIIERNFRCKCGEIDLIALEKQPPYTLIFIEVKYRRHNRYGSPIEQVTAQKQHKIIRTAKVFLLKYRQYENHSMRFDIIGIHNKPQAAQYHWLKNAFDGELF